MKMLKKIFAFVLLFSIVFSSIGINTFAKETSALTDVEDTTVMSPTEDGKRTFTLKGSDLEEEDIKAKVVLKGSTERLTEVEKSITFSEETKENTSNKVVTLTFPKNETGKMQQYEVSFSVKGDDESFVDEFKKVIRIRKSSSSGGGAVVPPVNPEQPKPVEENAILNVTTDTENLSAEGGEVNLTLFTKKINDKHISSKDVKLQVSLDGIVTELGKNIEVKGEKAKKTITLKFPKNNTSKEQVYTIKFNTKGSETDFQDEPIVTIKVAPSEQNNEENAIIRVTPENQNLPMEGGEINLELITKRVNENHISAENVKVQVLLNNIPTDLGKNAVVKGNKARKTITLSFPKNETSKEQVYTIKFNTNGSETVFQENPTVKITVEASEQSKMLVNELRVKTPNMPKAGGANTITVKGENLESDKLNLEIFKIEKGIENKINIDYTFAGTSEVQSATLNFPKAKSNKEEVYKIRLKDKEVTVTVGEKESGEVVDLVPSNVYLNNSKIKVTLKFDEKIFPVKDIESLKSGISYKKSVSDNFEKLKPEDKVEVVEDRIVITLANPIEIKMGAKINFTDRIIKDGKDRENRAFERFINDALPTVNEANFVEGEILTKVGGNAKVKIVGENLKEALKVKIIKNNKDKTSNSEITESANVKVEVINNNQQNISFKLPANKSLKAETYSVMVSLDGGKTYSSAIGVNILQNRAKRLVSTVLPTDKITDKPILSFMSIQSYGTSGGGTEQPDVTHTYTPVGQESKKTWVTMFGANFNKSLTKIKIVDENGIEWYPLQNEGTSDSMDNFIMVSADGTGIYGNGNTQMFELICPRNVTIPTNPNGDVTFKYLVAVDGENFDEEVFVKATVVNDKVGKKENMTADEISEVKVKHQTENGKVVSKEITVKGYKWSKLRSFNVRPIENNADFEAIKYKIVRADGSVEEKEIGNIHEEKVRDIKEVTFIYKSNINLDELNEAITNANAAKETDKYKYATEEIKNEFDKALEKAVNAVETPVSQENVNNLTKTLKEKTEKLDGVKPENPEEEVTLTDEETKISVTGKNLAGKEIVVKRLWIIKSKDVSTFDITFRDAVTKEKVDLPIGKYKVVIPKEKDREVLNVYHLPDKGQEEKVEFTQDSNSVTFFTTHFSKYVLEYKANNPGQTEVYEWVKNDDGTWTYQSSDGKLVVKDSWKFIDNEWYRFDKDGKMLSNKWFEENGKWYYIEENGTMSKNEWIIVNGEWYYANTSGRISQNEWVLVNENWYYANASGRISQNEWVLVNGNWYYANASGRIADSEWFIVGGKWYYAEKGGLIAQGKTIKINNINYTFDSNGVLVK
ncbi:N-acetylmuramoyl-L-alanine amidase family protein [Parvimonas sp. D2]|uniref:N-acetylmuramoyl-L-alanine amidase family protein n=1 Tax=unclassified Parvimonas TaxID=1151464 RepID=UPI002B45FCAF|nr:MULTISPECIES: N-acetylmuramoyl-L-alanine amidase family protein [unclassified Parvimonas]MEB3012326.1 N-acetylmuramoyl-L-alanine amidase family protein [Parvimonas sp. D2]MEB3087729.1 N-acetylmuramoyl-L-alanine amidase family protein [Parvimonas sp. D4]